MIGPTDKNAIPFREAIESNLKLQSQVELRFAPAEDAFDAIQEAEVVECLKLPAELLAAAPNLRWASFWSAGLDKRITPEMEARGLLVTSASGVHGPNIAEQVMAYMLMFTRRISYYMRSQIAGQWTHGKDMTFEELTGKTLGIVGLGHIGRTLATRALSFGMRIVATKRDTSNASKESFPLEAMYPAEDLPKMVERCDHVCIAVPYTRETHHLFDADLLSHMKSTAYLYNISRGKIVDEQALIEALEAGRLRGAGLDVFETEPLGQDSPLWAMENVIITPHIAGFTPYYFARVAALFADNLERYLEGQPLQNLYDPQRGY
jgi:D-2-hydroxyacid dehydrogenase (NADP+)